MNQDIKPSTHEEPPNMRPADNCRNCDWIYLDDTDRPKIWRCLLYTKGGPRSHFICDGYIKGIETYEDHKRR